MTPAETKEFNSLCHAPTCTPELWDRYIELHKKYIKEKNDMEVEDNAIPEMTRTESAIDAYYKKYGRLYISDLYEFFDVDGEQDLCFINKIFQGSDKSTRKLWKC